MDDALRLRHRMIPYLHTMNWRASRTGLPLVEPMYWGSPDIDAAYHVPNEYMFGTELLAAPITEPMALPAALRTELMEDSRPLTALWMPLTMPRTTDKMPLTAL